MYSDQFNPSYLSNKRYAQSEIFRGLMFHDVQLFTKIDSNFDVHETGDFRPVFAVIHRGRLIIREYDYLTLIFHGM